MIANQNTACRVLAAERSRRADDDSRLRERGSAGTIHRGVEQLVARLAHNQEVAGSSPALATIAGRQRAGHPSVVMQSRRAPHTARASRLTLLLPLFQVAGARRRDIEAGRAHFSREVGRG